MSETLAQGVYLGCSSFLHGEVCVINEMVLFFLLTDESERLVFCLDFLFFCHSFQSFAILGLAGFHARNRRCFLYFPFWGYEFAMPHLNQYFCDTSISFKNLIGILFGGGVVRTTESIHCCVIDVSFDLQE